MESGTVANFVQKNDVRLMLLKLVTDGPNRPASTLSHNYIRDLIGSRSSILLELGDKLFGLTTGS
jgi:nucleoside phosphorylase